MPSNSTRDSVPCGRPRFVMLLAGLVVLATLGALAASGQRAVAKGGVHFDPDSPAGKEYALPLDEARDEAVGEGQPDGASGASAPLFGVGISGRQSKGQGTAIRRGVDADRRASGGAKRSRSRKSTASAGPRVRLSD